MTPAGAPVVNPREALEGFIVSPRFVRLRPASRSAYAFDLERLVGFLEDRGVDEVRRVRLRDLRAADAALLAAGVGDAARTRSASAARTFFRWALQSHLVPRTLIRRRFLPRIGPRRARHPRPAARLPRSFGPRILAARTAAGMTQAALAALLGVHRLTVQRWESGAGAPRGAARVAALAFIEHPTPWPAGCGSDVEGPPARPESDA